ncbi:MAG: hypothetical protein CMK09_06655 [Ponticaulis sp.]|nr:hypothetical protein [Ponticaulis sp.]
MKGTLFLLEFASSAMRQFTMSRQPDAPEPKPLNAFDESEALARLSRHRAKPVMPAGQRLHSKIAPLVRKFEGKGTPGLPHLKRRWTELAGERLAKLSTPIKLSGPAEARILTLEILPAASPLFQHQGEFLKQHLSMAIGGKIVDIKLKQKVSTRPADGKPAARPLTIQEREAITNELKHIKNPKLAAALLAFGEAIYTHNR